MPQPHADYGSKCRRARNSGGAWTSQGEKLELARSGISCVMQMKDIIFCRLNAKDSADAISKARNAVADCSKAVTDKLAACEDTCHTFCCCVRDFLVHCAQSYCVEKLVSTQAMALVSRHTSLHSLNMKGVKHLDEVWHDLLQSIPG